MGKRLHTRFEDINNRIIKKKKKKKLNNEPNIQNLKRKASTHLVEPPKKFYKTERTQKDELVVEGIKIYEEKLSNSNDVVLKIENSIKLYDLLFSDESKNSYFNIVNRDFLFHVIDEISLEGLDGITIEAFWKRFSIALENYPITNTFIKKFIWEKVIIRNKNLKFFELPVARNVLEIYNHFDYMNTEIGCVLELAYDMPDIYPVKPVNDSLVLGSCSTFCDRIDISTDVMSSTIEEMEKKYGLKLVIVADQNLRTYTLCGDLIDPSIEFLNTEYCILERVGRSRKLGELTQGRMSIGTRFNMDAKTLFHYKKQLDSYEVISKQVFFINSPIHDQNKTGSLWHLRRFYNNIRSHQSFMADEVINILKMQPEYRIEITKLRQMFAENYIYVGKILKNPDMKKVVKMKTYPYRFLYPNAPICEYTQKNKQEKTITCLELVDPYVNVAAIWKIDDEESGDDNDETEEGICGHMIYNMDTMRNVYYQIYLSGKEGCTAEQIRHSIGIDVNTVRAGLRKLVTKGVVNLTKFDIGKTKKYKYTISCLEKSDTLLIPSPEEIPKISSVKAKILEKQRLAIEKKKQEHSTDEPNRLENIVKNTDKILTDSPQKSDFKFLIQNFEAKPEKKSTFTPILKEDIYLPKILTINLTFLNFNTKQLFNINKILEEILPNLQIPQNKPNFKNSITKTYLNQCMETKSLLLRVILGESNLLKETFQSKNRDVSETITLPDLSQNATIFSVSEQAKLHFMGDAPVVEFSTKDNFATLEILSSTVPKKYNFEKKYTGTNKTITDRVLDRIQIILDLVNEMQIIDEMMKLNKLVCAKEAKKGFDIKCDRKSLKRIIKRLVEEGYIKVYMLNLSNDTIKKSIIFICHPSVTHEHDIIQTFCQQLKWKYFTGAAKRSTKPNVSGVQKTLENKIGKSPFNQSDVLNSISAMRKMSRLVVTEMKKKMNRQMGKVYGIKPKFTRMRMMHEFLFYLVYGYTGLRNPMCRDDIRKLFKSYRIELTDTDLEEMPDIYSNEISWKMFVPPLPMHTGWPEGWALVCDIILRFPISVLLKIHNCMFEDSELLEVLNHPVKRFFLVKDLPEKIRKTILFKRKYLFDSYDTINRLVFIGLIQFGPQKQKEKDQVFIYLNRRASLRDTTSSAPGYNEVEKKQYPLLQYYFSTYIDVQRYWQSLNSISLNTKLNTRQPGKLVTLTYINTKSEIIQSVVPKTIEKAGLDDNGAIPGDGKGAAGLDSALWSHLGRNWFWTTKGSTIQTSLTNETLKQIPAQKISFKDMRSNIFPKFYLPISAHKKSIVSKISIKKLTEKKSSKLSLSFPKTVRTIKERKKLSKREYNDEIDKRILKKLRLTRARWTQQEEEYAILCKLGDIILNGAKKYKKQVVPFSVVRDVLHRICPMSKYKTSSAIQRRILKLQKERYTRLEDRAVNLFKLNPIADTFAMLINKIGVPDKKTNKVFKLSDMQLIAAYVILMSYIARNKKRVLDTLEGNLVNNDHLSEDNIKYIEETAVEQEENEKKYKDPKEVDDIKKDVVKSVIHCSLNSKGLTNFSNQLLKIYQNYSDGLIKEAVKELRESNTITCRTWKHRSAKIWDTPFALSAAYIFFQYTTFTNATADEAFHTFVDITKNNGANFDNTANVQNRRYGQLLGFNEFFAFYPHVKFTFYLPQNTIVLNPVIENHDELVKELAVRYQLKLKMLQQEGNETEVDFETDSSDYKSKIQDPDPVDEEKDQQEPLRQTKEVDTQEPVLDLSVDVGNSDTIGRLKTWISDCMTAEKERRSPSPEFITKTPKVRKKSDYSETYVSYQLDETEENEVSVDLKKSVITEKPPAQIPTIDEIKEGMFNVNVNDEERTIPHITELSDLLTKHFNDLRICAERLALLKSHFITQYVSLDHFEIDGFENLQHLPEFKYVYDSVRHRRIWDKIENDIIVKDFLILPNFEELIKKNGGNEEDIRLSHDIIQFAANKEFLGATAKELKEEFLWREQKCSLTAIVKYLIEAGIFLQMGIAHLTFVHYKYQYVWVVEKDCIISDVPSHSKNFEGSVKTVRMKIMPWVNVNGYIEKSILKTWLCNVLSYTLDFPRVRFGKLCKKFCYMKPRDLYYLLQILEELGCVELIVYENSNQDIFSDWTMPYERKATFLDNLDDIVIQPYTMAMIYLGAFFSQK